MVRLRADSRPPRDDGLVCYEESASGFVEAGRFTPLLDIELDDGGDGQNRRGTDEVTITPFDCPGINTDKSPVHSSVVLLLSEPCGQR